MDSETCIRSLFVLDTNAPWIRSFLHAMPTGVNIRGFRVYNAFSFPGGIGTVLAKTGRWEYISESWQDTWVPVPGWHKAFAASSAVVTAQVRRAIRRFGNPDAFLFTLPWYAKVAESLGGAVKAYYAHDTFRFYDWDREKTISLEARLLRVCDLGFGVADPVVNDLRELAATPVYHLRMATTWSPGETSPEGEIAADRDLRAVPKKRVGCVGKISATAYDWGLIEQLSNDLPTVHFVFVGPRLRDSSPNARVDAVFSQANVHWLGAKPHAHLPSYLRRFDVCINPLSVSDHGNRRSPLRLFDYLTTDRPVVSTAIVEAFVHHPFIGIASDYNAFRRLLSDALQLDAAPDLVNRWNYVKQNTWRQRAKFFSDRVDAACLCRFPRSNEASASAS